MKPKLVVVGAGGRMGNRIVSLAAEAGEFDIIAAVERQGHPDIGKDAGLVAAAGPINVNLTEVFPAAGDPQPRLATGFAGACVAVDFSQPEAADKAVDYCLENSVALVSGTTGLSDQQREKIKAASEKIPIIYGTNMSVGMNVLFNLVGKVATMLGDEYDIEITEQHHRFKKTLRAAVLLH